jgi:hypothetical protein
MQVLDPHSTWQTIFEKMTEGHSLQQILREDKSMPSTYLVYKMLSDHPELRELYQQAQEARAEYLAEEIMTLSDAPMPQLEGSMANAWVQRQRLRVDSRKWTASKLKPKVYGDHIDLTVRDERISVIQALEQAQARISNVTDVNDKLSQRS